MTGEPSTCPLCGARCASIAWRENPYVIAGCTCGFRHLAEQPAEGGVTYGDSYFRKNYLAVLPRRLQHARKLFARVRPLLPGNRLLDVGAGIGVFARAARELGLDVTAVDTSEAAARFAREEVGSEVQATDFLTMDVSGKYDAVTLWDVIEHVPRPTDFVAHARQVLRPGGVLVIKTPNVPGLAWQAARLAGRWTSTRGFLHVPSHVGFFDRRTLLRLTERASLEVLTVEAAAEAHALPASRSRLKSLLERCFWLAAGCLGQPESLLLVARRP